MTAKKQEMTLEDAFEKIEKTIEALEQPEICLEDSFQMYNEGMKLLKFCNDTIDEVEKKVLVIAKDGELHEFSNES